MLSRYDHLACCEQSSKVLTPCRVFHWPYKKCFSEAISFFLCPYLIYFFTIFVNHLLSVESFQQFFFSILIIHRHSPSIDLLIPVYNRNARANQQVALPCWAPQLTKGVRCLAPRAARSVCPRWVPSVASITQSGLKFSHTIVLTVVDFVNDSFQHYLHCAIVALGTGGRTLTQLFGSGLYSFLSGVIFSLKLFRPWN